MLNKEKIMTIANNSATTILDTFAECLTSISIPAGKASLHTFLLSLFIFAISLVCSLLGYPTFIRWQGCLIATCITGGLFIGYKVVSR